MIKGVSLLQGEAERAGTVQNGEEKAQRDLIHRHIYLMARIKTESGSSQWCPMTRHEAKVQTEILKIPFGHNEKTFFCSRGG